VLRRFSAPGFVAVFFVVLGLLGPADARGQDAAPTTFTNDSPVARSTLVGLPDLLSRGNSAEAARAVQRVLDDHAMQVVEAAESPELFVSVRARANRALRSDADLLRAYRDIEEARARALLESGRLRAAVRTRLLTPAGYEAALRRAQRHLESARFAAAWHQLLELDEHPDRTGAGGRDAARLLAQAARFVVDDASFEADAVREVVLRWSESAGMSAPVIEPIAPPAAAIERTATPLEAQPRGALIEGVLPKPFATVGLPGIESAEDDRQGADGPMPETWAIPTITPNLVIVNDGSAVGAWDRFSMTPRWTQSLLGDGGEGDAGASRLRRGAARPDAPTTVTVSGDAAFAVGGFNEFRRTSTDRIVHAFEIETGRRLWSTDPADLDRAFEGASPSGPIALESGVAVVLMRRALRAQRLTSVGLLGLDRDTGEPRWSTPLGSVGALPYRQQNGPIRGLTTSGGMAYVCDDIGFVASVHAATGEVAWLRMLPGATRARGARGGDLPGVRRPVIAGRSLFVISPDQSELVELDRSSGAVLTRRELSTLAPGEGHQILRVSDRLAIISDQSAAFPTLASWAEPSPETIDLSEASPLVGPAWTLGESLAIPTRDGLVRVDVSGALALERTPLDAPGYTAAADGQLVAVRGTEVHNFLNWRTASSMLEQRIDARPDDAAPAITLADLAFRGGRAERILPAVDQAIAALEAVPEERLRGRLFAVIESMLSASIREASDRSDGRDAELSRSLAESLLARLGRLADTPEREVAQLLLAGRLAERSGRTRAALEAYHGVLQKPERASSLWRSAGRTIRADLEATWRIERLVREAENDVYASFDTDAQEALAALDPEASPEAASRVAQRFPLAQAAPRAWLRAAELARDEADPATVRRFLRAGLSAADRMFRNGRTPPPEQTAEIASRLIDQLLQEERLTAAAGIARSAAAIGVERVVLESGARSTTALRDDLEQRLENRRVWPRIGPRIATEAAPQLLPGYLLRPTVSVEPGGVDLAASDPEGVLIFSPNRGMLSFAVSSGSDQPDPVEIGWQRSLEMEPVLLRRDDTSAWLGYFSDDERWIERIEMRSGETLWRSPPLASFVGGAARNGAERGRGPPGRQDDTLVTMDGSAIALANPDGGMALLDASNGAVLWSTEASVRAVRDIDLHAGRVLVAGTTRGGGADASSAVAVHDAETGVGSGVFKAADGSIRWARLLSSDEAVAATENSVSFVTLPAGTRAWSTRVPGADKGFELLRLNASVALLREGETLRTLDLSTGAAGAEAIPLPSGAEGADRFVRLARSGGSRSLVLGTGSGVMGLTESGAVAWRDGLGVAGVLTPPAATYGTVIVAETRADFGAGGGAGHMLHILDSEDGVIRQSVRLDLVDPPDAVAIVDGAVLVSAGEVVMAVPAPAEARGGDR